MKKLILPVLLGLAALASSPARAVTATGSFDVTVNLYPKCTIAIGAPTLTLHYVDGQTSASSNTMSYDVTCTNTQAYTLSIVDGSDAAATTGNLAGLNYTLSTPANGTGNGSAQTYNVTGTIVANQTGSCNKNNQAVAGTQAVSTTGANTGSALGTACSATSAANAHILKVSY